MHTRLKDRTGKELNTEELIEKVYIRIFTICGEFGLFFIHLVGQIPSHHIRRFFYRLAGMSIGKSSTIQMGARFHNPGNISIGDDTIIGESATLDGRAKLTIGNHVAIASEVMVYNAEHDIHDQHFRPIMEPVTIEDYVFVGPRAIILPGVTVGKGAVVGAGAVVTKHIEPFSVVGGVPARTISKRTINDPQYKIGRAALFR